MVLHDLAPIFLTSSYVLRRKAMTNLDSILKSRDITNKGPFSQSYGFSSSHVWMWELACKESRVLKNWCFWNVVLKRLLRVPWTARRSNQLILKGINPEYSLEGLMLKPKFQYFGHLMQRPDSLEKTLMLGGSGKWDIRNPWPKCHQQDEWIMVPLAWVHCWAPWQ